MILANFRPIESVSGAKVGRDAGADTRQSTLNDKNHTGLGWARGMNERCKPARLMVI